MSESNLLRFYYAKFKSAEKLFDEGDFAAADDLCIELVTEFQCPRLIQVQAWQLRSNCHESYWIAKGHLESALELIATLDPPSDLVQEYKDHTELMLREVERTWQAYWQERGEEPPTKQPEDEFVTEEEPVAVEGGDGGDVSMEEGGVEEQLEKLDIEDTGMEDIVATDSTTVGAGDETGTGVLPTPPPSSRPPSREGGRGDGMSQDVESRE